MILEEYTDSINVKNFVFFFNNERLFAKIKVRGEVHEVKKKPARNPKGIKNK